MKQTILRANPCNPWTAIQTPCPLIRANPCNPWTAIQTPDLLIRANSCNPWTGIKGVLSKEIVDGRL